MKRWAALMASGVGTALSPGARHVVACGGAEAQQRCRQGRSKAVPIMVEAASWLRAGRAGRAVLGSALGKQGSRAEEGERRERVERERDLTLSFLKNFHLKLRLKVKI